MDEGAEAFSSPLSCKWGEFLIQLGEVPFETVSNEHSQFPTLPLGLLFGYKPDIICQNRSLFIYSWLQNFERHPLNLGVYFIWSSRLKLKI